MLSKTYQAKAAQKVRSDGRELVQVGTCSGSSSVPPHTVQLFVFADISEEYALPSGHYTISERKPAATYNRMPDAHEAALHTPPGLPISIP